MPNSSVTVGGRPVEVPAPFRWQDQHLTIELPGAEALFTTRRGGFSTGPFATLNLGRLTADDPEAVARNRMVVQALAGGELGLIRQVHGSRVLALSASDEISGAEPGGELEEADGHATTLAGIAPTVLTADCLPIAVAGSGAVAMLHAGWRGLAEGIIAEGVRALRALAGERAPLVAAIGPGAGACCYEVGKEVHARFRSSWERARHGWKLDLKAIAREQLLAAGAATVHDASLCTICTPPSLFFSHRRDGGITGRQAGLVWLT